MKILNRSNAALLRKYRWHGFIISMTGCSQVFCGAQLFLCGFSICMYFGQPLGSILVVGAMVISIHGVLSFCFGILWTLSPDWDPELRQRFLEKPLPLWRFDQ